jgi:hypothetical protein
MASVFAAVVSRYGAARGRTVVEHGQPELVQHQQFLRQLMTNGQLGQPVDDRVDFGGGDPADLLSTGQSVRDAIGELRPQASPVAARVTVAGRGIKLLALVPPDFVSKTRVGNTQPANQQGRCMQDHRSRRLGGMGGSEQFGGGAAGGRRRGCGGRRLSNHHGYRTSVPAPSGG